MIVEPISTKQHFEILDGLRGIAALVVVVFHFMEIAILDYSKNFIAHGYLAVDFFFCLSGFVIAYAYDNRLPEMSNRQFIQLRLIRLHPLVIVGSILGLITFIFDPFSNLLFTYGYSKTILIFLNSILLIPYPIVAERYYNLFNLNAPAWSLFWEYVINLFYVFIFVKISKQIVKVLIFLAALVLCYIAFTTKNLAGGWGGHNFWIGGARVLFSFLMGILIFRSQLIIKNNLGFASISLLLLVAFLVPYNDKLNYIVEPIIVIIYFPVIIMLGAGATLKPSLRNITKLAGDISYPLYITHYPFIWIFLTYCATVKPNIASLSFIIPISITFLVMLAFLIMRHIDVPIRKYLLRKFNLHTC